MRAWFDATFIAFVGLVIFIGVLGGLFAWGLIGVFLGPVILAIAYELVQEWLRQKQPGAGG